MAYADKMAYADQYYMEVTGTAKSALNAVKETPLSRLSYAVEKLRKADAVVGETASRLVGERGPEPGDQAARAPVGSGFLGNIEELADSVSDLAGNILENIQRVERRI